MKGKGSILLRMKIIVAPDKFKGSLSSFEACNSIAAGIRLSCPDCTVESFPMADGGDGFAVVMKHYLQTETVYCSAVDPLGRTIPARYEWRAADKTAIIELAVASGLVLLSPSERNPLKTSTYGTGLLIKDALQKGATKIILGLGGSATNDAGAGILTALGFTLKDAGGVILEGRGEDLMLVHTIVPPPVLPAIDFHIACDVDNPLYGPQGAAFIYAPQKGASRQQVEQLDKGLRHFAHIVEAQTGRQTAAIPGAGAAGGIAVALIAYFNATLAAGTGMVIEASGIKNSLPGAGLIITGEGKIDAQTKAGKLPAHIAELAAAYHIPVTGLCGMLDLDEKGVKELGLNYAAEIMDRSLGIEVNMQQAAELLMKKAAAIVASHSLASGE